MRIVSTRNLNLHSKSTEGGLVHVAARRAKTVPDDVEEHPLFDTLVDSGVVAVLREKPKKVVALEPETEPEDPEITLVDGDDDEDESKETEDEGEGEDESEGGK